MSRLIVVFILLVLAITGCARTSTPSPEKLAQSTSTPEPSKVSTTVVASEPSPTALIFDFSTRFEDGKPYFHIETNLPDGMSVMFTVVAGEDIWGQSKVQVSSGSISGGPFSRHGEPYPPGEYALSISSPLLVLQSSDVQQALGQNGEYFYGDHIKEGRINFETSFTVEGNQEEMRRLREQELLSLQIHLNYLSGKLDWLDQAIGKESLDWVVGIREWNINLNEHRKAFDQEFGADINEYEGYCRRAFLGIGIAYGDMIVLWSTYDDFVEGRTVDSASDSRIADFGASLNEAQIAIESCRDSW